MSLISLLTKTRYRFTDGGVRLSQRLVGCRLIFEIRADNICADRRAEVTAYLKIIIEHV